MKLLNAYIYNIYICVRVCMNVSKCLCTYAHAHSLDSYVTQGKMIMR